jgi:hypothetical protein
MLASGTLIVGDRQRPSNILCCSTESSSKRVRTCTAALSKDVTIPAGERIGFDRAADAKRFTGSSGGIVVIPKSYCFGPRA